MTPHIEAKKEQIAKVCLMPGDPKRAKFIAENFLENFELVNTVRGILGYTGFYDGKRITVMAHGMGCPSIGIYSYELYNIYGVETIIRVGSCGALIDKLEATDVIVVENAFTDSNFANNLGLADSNESLSSDSELVTLACALATESDITFYKGNIFTSDIFYGTAKSDATIKTMTNVNKCIALEMESFALFANAKLLNKKALTLLAVSDSLVKDINLSPAARETEFTKMIKLALTIAADIQK